jgi:hypothetical protein
MQQRAELLRVAHNAMQMASQCEAVGEHLNAAMMRAHSLRMVERAQELFYIRNPDQRGIRAAAEARIQRVLAYLIVRDERMHRAKVRAKLARYAANAGRGRARHAHPAL